MELQSNSAPSSTALYILKTLSTIGFSLILLGFAGLYTFQSNLIYPASLNDGHGVVETPAKFGMQYEDVELKTDDGIKLQCFALKKDKQSPTYTNKTILILCPNAGNIGHSLPIVELFYKQLNYNVFIYSYRGYGHSSPVTPSERGLKKDADTVMKYLQEDPIFSTSSLVLYGRSLGGAVGIYIASAYPQYVSGVILENTFLSIRKVIPYIFPFLKHFTILCHQVWNSEELVAKVPENMPFCFINGLKDEIVPPPHMTKLFETCNSKEKWFHTFPDAYHNDTVLQDGYWTIVHDFIKNKINPVGY